MKLLIAYWKAPLKSLIECTLAKKCGYIILSHSIVCKFSGPKIIFFSKSCIWTKNFWPQSLLSTKVEPNVSSAWGHEARKLRVILTKLVRQHSWRQQTVNSHLSSDTDFQEKFSSLINTKTGTKSCVYYFANLQGAFINHVDITVIVSGEITIINKR